MIHKFDSLREYVLKAEPHASVGSMGDSWDLGITGKKACELATLGDPSVVASYSDALDKMKIGHGDGPRNRPIRDFAGTRVSVGDYLGGSPRAMYRIQKTESTTGHVKIVVCTTSSAGISAEDLLTRGKTVLSLLEILQSNQIAVDLYLTCEDTDRYLKDHIQLIRVESRPLDLSVAGFAIAHPAFARNVTYNYGKILDGFQGTHPLTGWDMYNPGCQARREYLKTAIDLQDDDIYLPRPSLDDQCIDNPEEWLNTVLEKFNV